jgi:23S rRNA (adenine2503-C2)-methyltransferase
MSCTFCHTGTQPLVRNLQAGEVVSQILTAKRQMYDFPRRTERIVSNIVFMGQGEPFYNYRNVKKAIQLITDPAGIAISKRRITVSTSGIVPNIKRLGEDFPGINLAISLHAVTDELRNAIVPANRQWPLAELLEACKNFPGLAPMRRIAFEYVMLKGINDSEADARELVRLLEGFPSFVNIIPFNPWPGSVYETSSNNQIMRFAKIITEAGIEAPIRWPRGRDILAACGQLKTETTKQKPLAN